MMKNKEIAAKTINQSNDAGSIQNKRGMNKRAKRNSSKKLRGLNKKEVKNATTNK